MAKKMKRSPAPRRHSAKAKTKHRKPAAAARSRPRTAPPRAKARSAAPPTTSVLQADLPDFLRDDADKGPRTPRSPDSDPFRPPKKNTRVYCMHCNQKYDSYRIAWHEFKGKDGKPEGFWCCPIDGCDGKGFLFDIHPTDPNWEDEEDRGMSGGWFDDDGNPTPPPFADVPW